jgi:hypothetical protein
VLFWVATIKVIVVAAKKSEWLFVISWANSFVTFVGFSLFFLSFLFSFLKIDVVSS